MSKRYFGEMISQIDKTFRGLDEYQFNQLLDDCGEAIKGGNKIIASGLGKNVPVCEKFVGTMHSLGLAASFLHTNTAMHGDLGVIKDGDVICILSKSGNTNESVLFAQYIQDWNVKTWLLSFNSGGRLAQICDHALLLPFECEGDFWNIVPNNSSSCYLILLQGMALQIAKRLGVERKDFKRNHPGGAIGEYLKKED